MQADVRWGTDRRLFRAEKGVREVDAQGTRGRARADVYRCPWMFWLTSPRPGRQTGSLFVAYLQQNQGRRGLPQVPHRPRPYAPEGSR
jgi:hypothetical protein